MTSARLKRVEGSQSMLSSFTTEWRPDSAIRVLLADCDQDTRQMYGEFLRQSSVELDEAADGREALAKALARPHDVIITETRLPGISGYELCQLLRRDVATKSTPIIVVTAEAFATSLERARKAGADVVLVKPCLPDVLLAEIRRTTRHSSALRQHSAELLVRSASQMSRAQELTRATATHRRALSRLFSREDTTTPPNTPPDLVCPSCDQPLAYQRSHVGGVSERHREQWDYYECANGCGMFQYRQRTRKLRRVS
jgi:two-component system, cell cycle response regulator DivK